MPDIRLVSGQEGAGYPAGIRTESFQISGWYPDRKLPDIRLVSGPTTLLLVCVRNKYTTAALFTLACQLCEEKNILGSNKWQKRSHF